MNQQERLLQLKRQVDDSVILRQAVFEQLGPKLVETADVISGVIGSGGKVMIAGNGSLASIASLFAGELVVRLSRERSRHALPAMALCADFSVMTGTADDYGFENVYSRQIEALGQKGDLLMILSATGNSTNLVRAAQVARERGLIAVALLGGNGGKLRGIVDRSLVISHPASVRIEEEHLFIVHLLVDLIERDLFV
ncbi:MAG: SIS domain-containing protein [candidate division Zixibacteria bacterium]|nr:SIS domain-containing protein [candidate division Zixibacteria bacterium]